MIELIKKGKRIGHVTATRPWMRFFHWEVPDPVLSRDWGKGMTFTQPGAWDLIRVKLEEGLTLEEVELEEPKPDPDPKIGWVMRIPLDLSGTEWPGEEVILKTTRPQKKGGPRQPRVIRDSEEVYVKLEIAEEDKLGTVFGRSFHL